MSENLAERGDYPLALRAWIDYLSAQFPAPVRVVTQPVDAPRFILLQRLPGTSLDLVTDNPTISIGAVAEDAEQAEQFATKVRTAVRNAQGKRLNADVSCKKITEYSGPYWDPDERTPGSSRFSWSFGSALRAVIKGE